MTRYRNIVIICLVFVLAPSEIDARIKCWKNKQGNIECGDNVPPEYAQNGHKEFTKQGLLVDEIERAKTDKEVAEQKRQQEIKEEQEREAAQKKRKDDILIHSYNDIKEIETARNEKITMIDSNIRITKKRNSSIEAELQRFKNLVEKQKKKEGATVNEEILKDIASLENQLRTNKEYIEKQKSNKKEITSTYQEDIDRFKELKNID